MRDARSVGDSGTHQIQKLAEEATRRAVVTVHSIATRFLRGFGYCPHRVPEADQATQSLRLVGRGERTSAADAEEDVVGFDTATPQLISDFARGAL